MYYLFGGDRYYAAGGVNDFLVESSELNDLKKIATDMLLTYDIEWFHITDDSMKIVCGTKWQAHDAEGLETGRGVALRYNTEAKSYYWD